jgi:hypothetical protein
MRFGCLPARVTKPICRWYGRGNAQGQTSSRPSFQHSLRSFWPGLAFTRGLLMVLGGALGRRGAVSTAFLGVSPIENVAVGGGDVWEGGAVVSAVFSTGAATLVSVGAGASGGEAGTGTTGPMAAAGGVMGGAVDSWLGAGDAEGAATLSRGRVGVGAYGLGG